MTTLLEVTELSKSFGGVTAITDLDFQVPEGVVYSIIGPNGAGKTTLFNLLSGIYSPDDRQGQIQFKRQDLIGLKPHRIAAKGISRTFQNLQLFHNMSVLENVMVGCHLRSGASIPAAILQLPSVATEEKRVHRWAEEALTFCGLEHLAELSADQLPYGELKRLEIARALAAEPTLLMMDEPAAGLNDTETIAMRNLIRQICDRGTTVLLVEHNMGLVMQVSDHILVLDYGSRLAEGTPQQIRNNQQVIDAYLGGEVHYAVE